MHLRGGGGHTRITDIILQIIFQDQHVCSNALHST
jgi:hypothetical protein